jgi:hypothetical protein
MFNNFSIADRPELFQYFFNNWLKQKPTPGLSPIQSPFDLRGIGDIWNPVDEQRMEQGTYRPLDNIYQSILGDLFKEYLSRPQSGTQENG